MALPLSGLLLGSLLVTALVVRRIATRVAQPLEALIVESSRDAVVGETLDGEITSWNTGAESIYGYSAAEILGKKIDLLVPHDRAGETDEVLRKLGREEVIDAYETERVRKDGTRITVALSASPIRSSGGKLIGV